MIAPATAFKSTRNVKVVVYLNGYEIKSDTWDVDFWVWRPEEMYGLMASNLKDKKVRVIDGEKWRWSKEIPSAMGVNDVKAEVKK